MRAEGRLPQDGDNRRRKRLNVRRVAGVAALLLVLFVGGLAAGAWYFLSRMYNPIAVPEKNPEQAVQPRINILLMGLDGGVNGKVTGSTVHSSRTDTMMVVSVDPEMGSVGVLSIPRDTRVKIPGRSGYDKMAHAHVYGGPKLAMETVAGLIGEPVRYYVRIGFDGFVKLVDMIGGVEMNIEQNMDYDDPYQDLHIHLKAGRQVLNGEKALEFVRYRKYLQGDIDRVKAQQKFIDALAKSFFDMNTLWKLPSLASEASKHIDTNIEPQMMLSLANMARQVRREDIRMDMIPGQPADISDSTGSSLSYWVADQQGLKKVVDLLVRGIDREANSKVRVRIVNATGDSSAGGKAAAALREAGYIMVTVADSQKPEKGPTRVTGADAAVVKAVCRRVLEFAPKAAMQDRSAGDEADVSIVLGVDFNLK